MMNRMMILTSVLVLSLAVMMLPGCSIFGEPVAEKVADAVEKYCEEPFSARQLYRQTVNNELAREGHAVTVNCAGDPDTEPQSFLYEPGRMRIDPGRVTLARETELALLTSRPDI